MPRIKPSGYRPTSRAEWERTVTPKEISVGAIFPEQKDLDRAEGLARQGKTFHGSGAPFAGQASKMAKLITNKIKLVRRAMAVVEIWGPRGYIQSTSTSNVGHYHVVKTVDDEYDVWTPFEERLRELGFSSEQIGHIKSYNQNEDVSEKAKLGIAFSKLGLEDLI